MNGEAAYTTGGDGLDKTGQDLGRDLFVYADAAFHGDFSALGGLGHCGHAIGDQFGALHQDCAETSGLHTIRRATDVQVDLVISKAIRDLNRRCQFRRIASAQLKR